MDNYRLFTLFPEFIDRNVENLPFLIVALRRKIAQEKSVASSVAFQAHSEFILSSDEVCISFLFSVTLID